MGGSANGGPDIAIRDKNPKKERRIVHILPKIVV